MNPISIRFLLLAVTLGCAAARAQGMPPADQNLVLTAPIKTWDEAIPLRLGAASDGSHRFKGEIARVLVAGRALGAVEIAALADKNNAAWVKTKEAVLTQRHADSPMIDLSAQFMKEDIRSSARTSRAWSHSATPSPVTASLTQLATVRLLPK